MSGAVVEGVDFDRWAVIVCKPAAVARGLVPRILERIASTGITVSDRMDVVAQPWQAHVAYRDLLADTGRHDQRDLPAYIDAAYSGQRVSVALAHGGPGVHAELRQLIGHTDPTRAVAGTIRGDLGEDSVAVARSEKRLVRNLVHTSDDPDAARREYGTWYRPGIHLQVSDFDRCSVILCKPDAVARGLVDDVLGRIAAAGATVTNRLDVTVQPWQAHVHYWDLLVDADWFPDRDIPACLDDAFAGKRVTVALAHGEPGIHAACGIFSGTSTRPRRLPAPSAVTSEATGSNAHSPRSASSTTWCTPRTTRTPPDGTSAPGSVPPGACCSPPLRPACRSSPRTPTADRLRPPGDPRDRSCPGPPHASPAVRGTDS